MSLSPYLMQFSIRDLEEFTGVKAHTIRMWEKRYGLLAPERTDTNIRTYSLEELKSLLNISYLNHNGYKISKIAALKEADRQRLVQDVSMRSAEGSDILNSLKLAMLSFDEALFDAVTNRYRMDHSFSDLLEIVFVPLLEQIGVLWQTNTICPAHEHFISNLIRQKLLAAADGLTKPPRAGETVYVLYLPENEIHELGLLYANYLLRSVGNRTIYLGQSVPRDDLRQVADLFTGNVVFVTMLMANPPASELGGFLNELRAFLPEERIQFWVTGGQIGRATDLKPPAGVSAFADLKGLIARIK